MFNGSNLLTSSSLKSNLWGIIVLLWELEPASFILSLLLLLDLCIDLLFISCFKSVKSLISWVFWLIRLSICEFLCLHFLSNSSLNALSFFSYILVNWLLTIRVLKYWSIWEKFCILKWWNFLFCFGDSYFFSEFCRGDFGS